MADLFLGVPIGMFSPINPGPVSLLLHGAAAPAATHNLSCNCFVSVPLAQLRSRQV